MQPFYFMRVHVQSSDVLQFLIIKFTDFIVEIKLEEYKKSRSTIVGDMQCFFVSMQSGKTDALIKKLSVTYYPTRTFFTRILQDTISGTGIRKNFSS